MKGQRRLRLERSMSEQEIERKFLLAGFPAEELQLYLLRWPRCY
jgi:hypothetical protein